MKLVFVDGYNVLNSWPNLKTDKEYTFDGTREKLIDIMHNYGSYSDCKVILVFDGYKVAGNREKKEEKNKNLTIVFTKDGQTADSYIEKYISSLSKYDDIEVATSDYAEQQIILGKGASRISARELKLYVDNAMVKIKEEQERHQQKIQRNFLEERLDKDILSKLEKIRRKY